MAAATVDGGNDRGNDSGGGGRRTTMQCSYERLAMNVAEDFIIDLPSEKKDVISDLPRDIIDRILARMPIRDVARTSVLSRKWRQIWATHPQLMFDHQFNFNIETTEDKPFILQNFVNVIKKIFNIETTENKPFKILQNFVNVINKIFLLHTGPILKFSLYIPPPIQIDHNHDIDHWMLILSSNGIKELTFESASPYPYKLPSCIFSCPQLTRLKLCNCIIKPPHAFKCFGNLISLSFENIIFTANMLETLFSSAPLLENLFILSCIGIEHFNIQAPSLKVLQLGSICGFKSISFKNSPNLAIVVIAPLFEIDNSQWAKTTNLIELVASLPRIERLLLDNFVLKVLAAGTVSKRLPAIKNLRFIQLFKINFNDLDQISCILCLLKSSTNLQDLYLQAFESKGTVMQPVFNFLKESKWMYLKLNTLQTAELVLYGCSRTELFFIEFLLARCLILERIFIQLSGVSSNEGFRVLKKVVRFSRASEKAEVIFEYRESRSNI
ncbi:F-box/FBD/LRR-repeat protein At1g13570-like [Cornus florida]|uniref:F-box/FBD/LRR-repeat protein At1g13570-like n=1 Tax=Cornus florida TaxID=4283 RepID=UPI00289AC2CC|nr:F-box/FBD/LRR-repeat protein At1g13570-like [Cornus florida]